MSGYAVVIMGGADMLPCGSSGSGYSGDVAPGARALRRRCRSGTPAGSSRHAANDAGANQVLPVGELPVLGAAASTARCSASIRSSASSCSSAVRRRSRSQSISADSRMAVHIVARRLAGRRPRASVDGRQRSQQPGRARHLARLVEPLGGRLVVVAPPVVDEPDVLHVFPFIGSFAQSLFEERNGQIGTASAARRRLGEKNRRQTGTRY